MAVAHVNIRSLNSGFSLFTDIVREHSFDLIGVSETWLSRDYPSEYVAINNYQLVRADRPTRGGGLGVYIKNGFKYKMYHKNNSFESGLEQLWLKVKVKKKYSIGLCVVYKQPNVNLNCLDDFYEVLERIYTEVDSIIIIGDININLLNEKSNDSIYFKNILVNFNLNQMVTEPTRITENSESLIDIICVSDNLLVKSCENIEMHNVTDHMLTSCNIIVREDFPDDGKKYFRNFNNLDYANFGNEAIELNWNEIYIKNDINHKINLLNENINYLFDKYVPLVEYNPNKKKNPPYITYTIKEMIHLKKKARSKYLRTKNATHKNYYLELKNYVSQAIKQEKIAYMKYQIKNNENNPRDMWKKLNEWGVKNSRKMNLCSLSDETTPDDINKYFINIAGQCDVDDNLIDFYNSNIYKDLSKFKFKLVTRDDISNILRNMKTNAFGIDNINLKMIKIILPFIMDYVVHIINVSLTTGVFPVMWKTAVVIPCPKIEHSSSLNDLRPLSILPALSKFIEKIVAYQLKIFLEQNNILPGLQSGFRNKHSTQTALMKVTDDIGRAIDNSELTFLILLDQSKAFDVVNFELLLAKLKFIGFDNLALIWFKNYLYGRMQCVKYDDNYSDYITTRSGVPQGSILGPILFSIFIFDIGNTFAHCSYHLYADDMQIYLSFSVINIEETVNKINHDLSNFATWCQRNGLRINPNKSVALCIGTDYMKRRIDLNRYSISMNNTEISLVSHSKNLGLILDDKLNFEKHVNKVVGLSFLKLKMLNKLKYSLDAETKLKLIHSLVYPHLDYCLPVYYNYLTQSNKNKLQKIQNAGMRFAYCIPYRHHVTPYFRNELKIEKRFIYLYCVLLHKIISSKCPLYLFKMIKQRSEIHNVNIRVDNYTIPQHRTTKFKGSFSYNAPSMLNKVVKFLCLSETSFKRSIKDMLLSEN